MTDDTTTETTTNDTETQSFVVGQVWVVYTASGGPSSSWTREELALAEAKRRGRGNKVAEVQVRHAGGPA